MKQWLNGVFVGLAIGLVGSIFYRSQQIKPPEKKSDPRLDKDIAELETWWKNLPTERKIDLELNRIEEENRLEDESEESDES